jgi:hypothetical protein
MKLPLSGSAKADQDRVVPSHVPAAKKRKDATTIVDGRISCRASPSTSMKLPLLHDYVPVMVATPVWALNVATGSTAMSTVVGGGGSLKLMRSVPPLTPSSCSSTAST